MSRNTLALLIVIASFLSAASPGFGQKPPQNAAGNPLPQGTTAKPAAPAAPRAGQNITITESVRPAFVIDPIVNRIETRPGRTIPVEFGITCESKPVKLEIQRVALTQDENGTIFANTKVPPPEELEIQTPLAVELQPTEKFVIRGRVRVPNTQSTFHTFGILVRDAGQLTDPSNAPKSDTPRVGIRFVTQYLLRCDITVQGIRSESAAKLKVSRAELIEVNGIPMAQVYVENPTAGPIEFGLRAQIRHSENSENRPTFPLWMPVRSNTEEPQKFIGRILAGARIRMISPLNAAVFPGEYYMESSLVGDNRVLVKVGFPVIVQEGDFPAQGIATVQAAPGLLVSPSQVELSLQRGGSRTHVVQLENTGTAAVDVQLVSESIDGIPADWVVVRPDSVTLPPGTRRKVSLSFTGTTQVDNHRYSYLRLKTQGAGADPLETTPVLVAALGRSTSSIPELTASPLTWDAREINPAFVVELKNSGTMHFPINGLLILGDEAARPYEVRGGFGKWVLPGGSESIRFKPPANLAPGHYTARLIIPTGEGKEPLEQRLELDLGNPTKTP
ncbi:MAG: hypothetical protein DWH91_03245 [Planctomycetota bacterium]|nr:MAG: hypothetical protein DWH91_03245 [Planctomycetota bacterium]